MVGLTIHFNIGNYLNKNLFGFPNFFTFQDFGLVLAFIAGLSAGNFQLNKISKELKSLLTFLYFFAGYQVLVSIIINLNFINNPGRILVEIASHKWRIFSIFFCIPAYFVIQKNARTIFNYIVIISVLVLSAYLITLLTPLKLIETQTLARGFISGATRVWFENWGYIQLCILLALTVYLLKIEIGYKEVLYYSGLMIFISTLITLTRGTIVYTIGSIFLLLFFLTKYLNVKLSKTILYATISGASSIILILFIFPDYLTLIFETFNLTFLELTGKIRTGSTQSRTQFELVTLWPLYIKNFFWGTGLLSDYFDQYGTKYELGLADFAVLGNLAIYGTIGFAIYLMRYIKIHKQIKIILKKFKNDILLKRLNNYELLLLIWAIATFYAIIFFSFFNFSIDLVYGGTNWGLMIGFIYGLTQQNNKR